jgi:site-specific recombinase XerD
VNADFSPHDLRHSHISDLIGAGTDLQAVQIFLVGHASVNTTVRRGKAPAKKAAGTIVL